MRRIDTPDTSADIQLNSCLDQANPKSFVMIAGAGAGKTTSLIKALGHVLKKKGDILKKRGQKIACITYTEIAAKEIWDDVGNNPLVQVSTIHSFLWDVTGSFQKDILSWLSGRIEEKIEKLSEAAANFTNRTQARTREKNRQDKEKLIGLKSMIGSVKKIVYGSGSKYEKGILGHDDVIKMSTQLIQEKELLQTVISQKYPIVFIDESQDTFPDIVATFKSIYTNLTSQFCLGFFGDPVQKIYATGIGEVSIEENWQRITKEENFRSSTEVLKVINKIRREADGLVQRKGNTNNAVDNGSAFIFILPADARRTERLTQVKEWMAIKREDPKWASEDPKILVIVHRMAATRLGFPTLYSAMNDNSHDGLKTAFIEGTSWPLKPFRSFILPIVTAQNAGRKFEVMNLLREYCLLLSKENIQKESAPDVLGTISSKINELKDFLSNNSTKTVLEVLKFISHNHLIELDERFNFYLNESSQNSSRPSQRDDQDAQEVEQEIATLTAFLACPAKETWGYNRYVNDESPFSTQHGVKGTQYERVLTVLDDEENTFTLFSYNKYFGIEPLSDSDKKRIEDGQETTIDRTRRLFYVCCSRAMKDLVVVYFASNIPLTIKKIKEKNIFEESNIYTIDEFQL